VLNAYTKTRNHRKKTPKNESKQQSTETKRIVNNTEVQGR